MNRHRNKYITVITIATLIAIVFLFLSYPRQAGSQVNELTPSWTPAGLRIDVASQPGCLFAMPGDTGTGLCDFEGGHWWGTIPHYGDQALNPMNIERYYELRGLDGRAIATVRPSFITTRLPIIVESR